MLKKFFELVIITLLLPIWLPLIVLIIVLSLLFNGRPIFFLQNRGGYKNKKFKIIKFRTIDKNNKINGYSNYLRFFKLDELPQIINILKGDLSLVGPRPLQYEYKDLYKTNHLKRFNVMPGITGWSQIKSDDRTTWLKRFEYDLWYVENRNFILDIKILLITFKKIIQSLLMKNKKSYPIQEFNGTN